MIHDTILKFANSFNTFIDMSKEAVGSEVQYQVTLEDWIGSNDFPYVGYIYSARSAHMEYPTQRIVKWFFCFQNLLLTKLLSLLPLELATNNFVGTIPTEIGNLNSLEVLGLSMSLWFR